MKIILVVRKMNALFSMLPLMFIHNLFFTFLSSIRTFIMHYNSKVIKLTVYSLLVYKPTICIVIYKSCSVNSIS